MCKTPPLSRVFVQRRISVTVDAIKENAEREITAEYKPHRNRLNLCKG